MYCFMISSVTLPLLRQKYPLAHKWPPQYCLRNFGNSPNSLYADFPLSFCTKLLIANCGGIDTIIWTWSFDTCPFITVTCSARQISLIKSLNRNPISVVSTALRYFVNHTICRCISYTVCAPCRCSFIARYFTLSAANAGNFVAGWQARLT